MLHVTTLVRSARSSPGTLALLLVGLVVLVQAFIFSGLLASQRDTAHIVDISGEQRTGSQRIAYLAATVRAGTAERGWQREMQVSIDAMKSDGSTAANRAISRYARAAQAIVRNPRDARALHDIFVNRIPLLRLSDRGVRGRARIIDTRNTQLFGASVAGFAIVMLTIFAIWSRVIVPDDRRSAALLARLALREAELKSLFLENPDAVAYYDLRGGVVRGNTASFELLGPASFALIGKSFLESVDPADVPKTGAAFARSVAGERVSLDTHFVDMAGEPVDVHLSLFPNVVDGQIVGVIGVARDTRALRRAEAAYSAQSERINELYRVSSFASQSAKRQVEETLAVAAQRLGYDWAAFVLTDGAGAGVATAWVGDAGPDCEDALVLPLPILASVRERDDSWSIDDIGRSGIPGLAVRNYRRWVSLAGTRVMRGANVCGSLVVGSLDRMHPPLETSDFDFLHVVAALVNASIQRGEHERRLDALAYFDALTGLPNRVYLADRMSESLSEAPEAMRRFAVHCLDLDHFKPINDSYGHGVGDEVLRVVARRMERCTRESDTVARIGGDEFVILQPIDGDDDCASILAERVMKALAVPIRIGDVDHRVGVSIGTSFYPGNGADETTLLASADAALLCAKREGRERQRYADDVLASAV
ncbi:MAG: hypothetical protein NVSMB59_21750 [Vulcanimicrobiaceae bacterium]